MTILQKIPVNNQRTLIVAKENNTYYKWYLEPDGERDPDVFWNSEISPENYKLLMEDYHNGRIPNDFSRGLHVEMHELPFESGNAETVIMLSNWFAHAYMTWDGRSKCWKYGRNGNYEYEMRRMPESEETV